MKICSCENESAAEQCSICGCENISVTYCGPIRIGTGMQRTEKWYDLYHCSDCGTIWHENDVYESGTYYQSAQYRIELEGTADIDEYYRRHDRECLEKFNYAGTDIFRDKTVADIGCGGGSWLDFLKGVAKKTIAIEPSEIYREHLKTKGHDAYAYTKEALKNYADQIDVLCSFDVIEHVDDPQMFAHEIFQLMKNGGQMIIGTPTDLKHLRELIGKEFDSFVFSVQHPWVFAEKGLTLLFENAGFQNISVKSYMRYGLGNVFAWLDEIKPQGHITYPCISKTINEAWKANLAETGYGDYLVVYATK